jgi:hypothetical protein
MSDITEELVHSLRSDSPFLQACQSRPSLHRAAKTALVVGPILALINQTSLFWRLLHGEMLAPIAVVRISLTFAVPFLVSLYSSAMSDVRRLAKAVAAVDP